jgi:peptide/nickel transport system substrate-binding protein
LIASGGVGLSAAFLAACGGSDSGGSSSTSGSSDSGKSALVVKPTDTAAQAKRGGVLKDYAQAEPRTLDPVQPLADYNRIAPFTYSTLLVAKPGKLKPATGELQGGVAESWETAPDGLTLTFKLRPNVKWHNRAPVNGRALDTQDVLFSLERYAKKGPLGTLVFNSASPSAPVLSTAAPDASTITMKLKDPIVYIPNWFAAFGSFTGQIIMYPKEADSSLNLGNEIIGTGPFQLKSHTPSVNFVLERNPEFWDKDAAMFDTIEMPIVQEYASRLAQLKAGNIYYAISRNTLRSEDVLTLKKDEPRILLYQSPFDTTAGTAVTFGHLPVGQNKFQDERVRQAVSMSWDRDLYVMAYYNVDSFQKAGMPVDTAWNSGLNFTDSYNAGGWYLDPKGKDFGPNAKYYQHDLAEAKKLLAAAGFPNGFDVTIRYPNSAQYTLEKQSQPIFGFLQELGLKVKQMGQTDYTQDYIPNNRDASGNFEGMGIHSVTGGTPTLISAISSLVALHLPSSGVTFNGYDITGKGDKSGDPQLISILEKARVEKDVATQKKLLQDAQRYLGKAQHSMLMPGTATGFDASWPAVSNFNTWDGGVDETWEHYQMWMDSTKAPLGNG